MSTITIELDQTDEDTFYTIRDAIEGVMGLVSVNNSVTGRFDWQS